MFVFYYSVLSEVTPPTALAAVGASAVTGGRVIPTMWHTLRYAAPAFLVPIAFVLTEPGEYLLGRGPGLGVLWAVAAACAGIVALSFAAGGWVLGVGAGGRDSACCSPATAALLLLFLASRHDRGGIGVSARSQSRSPSSTRGDGHETYSTTVLAALAADRHSPPRMRRQAGRAERRHRRRGHLRGHHGHPGGHRDRQRDRGVLLARQRLRRTDLGRHRRQGQGHRRRDRGVGAEHPAARRRHVSGGVLARRHRRRRGAGQGQLRRQEAARAGALAHLPQLHPGDRPQRRRHHLDRRHAGQAGLDRLAGVGHRGDRQPAAGIGGPGPGIRRRRAATGPDQDASTA